MSSCPFFSLCHSDISILLKRKKNPSNHVSFQQESSVQCCDQAPQKEGQEPRGSPGESFPVQFFGCRFTSKEGLLLKPLFVHYPGVLTTLEKKNYVLFLFFFSFLKKEETACMAKMRSTTPEGLTFIVSAALKLQYNIV